MKLSRHKLRGFDTYINLVGICSTWKTSNEEAIAILTLVPSIAPKTGVYSEEITKSQALTRHIAFCTLSTIVSQKRLIILHSAFQSLCNLAEINGILDTFTVHAVELHLYVNKHELKDFFWQEKDLFFLGKTRYYIPNYTLTNQIEKRNLCYTKVFMEENVG